MSGHAYNREFEAMVEAPEIVPTTRPLSISESLIDLGVISLLFIFFASIGDRRLIGADEGFYLYAAKLVAQGKLLYSDFLYPQMPYLPYFYSAWMKVFGFNWDSARALSALFAAAGGLFLFKYVHSYFGRAYTLPFLLIFCLSGWTFPWFTYAKTYSATLCFLSIPFYLLGCPNKKLKPPTLFLAGLCCSVAIGFRLYLVVAAPLFVAMIFARERNFRSSIIYSAWFAGGMLLGGIPILIYALINFDVFWYNNLGYHLKRSRSSDAQNWKEKALLLRQLFNLEPTDQLLSSQFLILSIITTLHSVSRLIQRRLPESAFVFAVILGFVSATPNPIYLQYFCVSFPFMLLCFLSAWKESFAFISSRIPARITYGFAFALALASLAYIAAPFKDELWRYTNSGSGVTGVYTRVAATAWRVDTAQRVSEELNKVTTPGEVVLSLWPGYLLESHAVALIGTENHFAPHAANRLGVKVSDEYKLLSVRAMEDLIREGKVSTLVINEFGPTLLTMKPEEINSFGYKRVAKIYSVTIYKRTA